jgi:hypothetical protein
MKDHFLKIETPENKIRFLIFQLMTHMEGLYDALDKMLDFSLTEDQTKDLFEDHFIKMERLHRDLGKVLSPLKENTAFEETPLHEPVRRAYNLLRALNHIDLDKPGWAGVAARALPDKLYYRQIKLLVY